VSAPQSLRVPPQRAGLRADVFFAIAFPFLSRARTRQKIQQGEALLNGRRFATSARLRDGDEITIAWRGPVPCEDAADGAAPAPSPVILHEDAWYVVVDKPAGQASHPSGGTQTGTLVQQVREYLRADTAKKLAGGDRDAWPVLANRLDRFTSGIVMVAKTVPALVAIQELRGGGLVRRSYQAVVTGEVAADTGVIDAPISPVRNGGVGIRMAVSLGGSPSRTGFRVLRRGAGHTVLEAVPETGRQHQVRVHLASIGHPVIGDLLYPDEAPFLRWWANGCRLDETLPARHLLHARTLSFVHPFTGDEVAIESPIPADFTTMLAALKLR
jgi:23S rRNA pseudouridine1911/1915/1917 synthase